MKQATTKKFEKLNFIPQWKAINCYLCVCIFCATKEKCFPKRLCISAHFACKA